MTTTQKQKPGESLQRLVVRRCSECTFYENLQSDDEEGIDEGECRRFPPQLHTHNASKSGIRAPSDFPAVLPDDWCGEFKPLP